MLVERKWCWESKAVTRSGWTTLSNATSIIFISSKIKMMRVFGGKLLFRMYGFPKIVRNLKNSMLLI